MRSISCSLITILLLSIPLSHARAQLRAGQQKDVVLRYVVDRTWPSKPDRFEWAQMPGVTVDARDNIYIFTRSKPGVQIYRPDGRLVDSWDVTDVTGAHYIRIGPEGNIWAANIASHTVCKYSPEGKLLLTLGEPGRAGTDEGHFDKPTDMTVLPSGDVFVTDGYGNRRVVHFDAKGKYINQWGEAGTGPGQFALPHSIVADSGGRIYVADRENARIQVFDRDGKLLAVWADTVTPWGLWMTKKDEIWVCGSSAFRKGGSGQWIVLPPQDQVAMKLNREGKVLLRVPLRKTTLPPGASGELNWVHGIAFDSQGNLYLGDIQGQRAQKFTLRP
ncbi:MAG: peptidyl-alpha-hydroxyglycine alpha-amidating lyase family protein [Planctomycetota bacterium]